MTLQARDHRYRDEGYDADKRRRFLRNKQLKKERFCRSANKPKISYATKKKALTAVRFLKKDFGNGFNRVYFCNTCLAWHITTHEKKKSVEKLEEIQRMLLQEWDH